MSQQTPIISIRNLVKKYAEKGFQLGPADLDIYPGKIIGYIGPNGAGKTTTVKILTGMLSSFEGEATVAGHDLRTDVNEVKKIIGYVPENAVLYEYLTPMEYFMFTGTLYGLSEETSRQHAEILSGLFELSAHVNVRIKTFSRGMKQKVLIIAALLHNPSILFFDEPLSGLDAGAVTVFKELITDLASKGKTIFYCSHMMDAVEKISDRIIILNEGNVIADGTFESLRTMDKGESLEAIFNQLTGFKEKSGSLRQALEFLGED